MGKYQYGSRMVQAPPRPWEIHPIWRGIGCLMIIIIPILSYAGAVLFVDANQKNGWLRLPPEFTRAVVLPFVGVVPHLLSYVVTTIILMLIGFAALMIIYSILYRAVGPSQYSPIDSPPVRRR